MEKIKLLNEWLRQEAIKHPQGTTLRAFLDKHADKTSAILNELDWYKRMVKEDIYKINVRTAKFLGVGQ